jgi:uncharacterized membrane protein
MMSLASLTFSGSAWLWPAVGAAVVAALAAFWSYRAASPGAWRWVCAGLKALGIALLAFCLLEPLWSAPRARPGANLFAILADNSQGMQVHDRGNSLTRGELMQRTLGPEGGAWQDTLGRDFEIRRFSFDTHLRSVAGFESLDFRGPASGIGTALQSLRDRYRDRPLAGVLLFTDGNATDLSDGLGELPADLPVFPVVVGKPGGVRDTAITRVGVSQTAFEDAPVTIQIDATATDLDRHTLQATLFDEEGTEIDAQSRPVRGDDARLTFRFRFRPVKPGLSFHRVNLESLSPGPANEPQPADEATLLNNQAIVPVDRGRGPHRILYVAGRPNWEYKFLNRAVKPDPELQLVALIRVALREPKFDFLGRAGETGNPLFRGFGNQSREEVARYDQPVLQRLNTRDELELNAGFPKTPEELFEYRAVILDDVEAGFFTTDQLALLHRFVSERGGGLLMLGGAESLREGDYAGTPLADALPVYLDRSESPARIGGMRFDLAREGWLEAWTRLRDNERDEQERLREMPAFGVLNAVKDPKPGAQVEAVLRDAQDRPWPALVTQRYGRGRSAVVTIGDVWRWGMQSPDARTDMEKFWRQLMRWLVADTPARTEITVHPESEPPGSVRLEIRLRGPDYQPFDDASVALHINDVFAGQEGNTNAGPLTLRAEPSMEEPGLFTALHTSRSAAGYRAETTVTNAVGAEIGRAEAGWSVDLAAEEFRSIQPNVGLLEAIARHTGGSVLEPSDLGSLVKDLPNREAPVMEPQTNPLWHTPWAFGLALGCFLVEWGIRRRKGLP